MSAKQLKTNKLKYTVKLYLVKMIVKANKLVYKVIKTLLKIINYSKKLVSKVILLSMVRQQLKDVFMNNLLFTFFVAKNYTAK